MIPSLAFKRRYLTRGPCPAFRQNYDQVLSLFSGLLSVSICMILLIASLDIGGYRGSKELLLGEAELIQGVQALTGIYILLQLCCLVVLLLYRMCPGMTRDNTYVLSVAVGEPPAQSTTLYGSTYHKGEEEMLGGELCVFYHRVTGSKCQGVLEPLSLPLHAALVPLQILCLVFSLVILILHSALLDLSSWYVSLTVISVINSLQQLASTALAFINATDTGFCCFGLSITRWFLHQDVYTATLENLVNQTFTASKKTVSVAWYKSTLVDEEGISIRPTADEEEQVHDLLSSWHNQLYREVFVVEDDISLFLTKHEMERLNEFYTARILTFEKDENVIFQR